ncbi:MAG: hypothetical protein HC853_00520 [Anaerolineae bacterium]|nr:hypothetical protein [Anaerolineae bacterium]
MGIQLKNISRVNADSKHRRKGGWYARLNHGKKRLLAFSDSEFGGRDNALRAAQLARAQMWLSYISLKRSLRPRATARANSRSKTGITGVSRGELKSGENLYPYWCAYFCGEQHRFFDHQYKDTDEALREAKRKRREMVAEAARRDREQYLRWREAWGEKARSPLAGDVLLAYQKAMEMANL